MPLLVMIVGFWSLAAISFVFGCRTLFAHSRSTLRSALCYSLLFAFASFAWGAFWTWQFRDGIGDAPPSNGGVALSRFWQQFQFPCYVVVGCALISAVLYAISSRRVGGV